jgi:hypothetical protein
MALYLLEVEAPFSQVHLGVVVPAEATSYKKRKIELLSLFILNPRKFNY